MAIQEENPRPTPLRNLFEKGVPAGERTPGSGEEVAGYKESSEYPSGFNAADFPLDGSSVRMTGNNMAFFFASPEKDATGQILDIKPDTRAFRRLIENIVKSGTPEKRPSVRMQIDADVFENPSRFVDKYWEMRSEEAGEAKRRELLDKEAAIIRSFVESGGIKQVVKDVLQGDANARGQGGLPGNAIEALTDKFLKDNFTLEGVRTDAALKFATWEVNGWERGKDTLLARQEYDKDTLMTKRRWKLGRESVIKALAAPEAEPGSIEKGASQILEATDHTRQLTTVNLTNGLLMGSDRNEGQSR